MSVAAAWWLPSSTPTAMFSGCFRIDEIGALPQPLGRGRFAGFDPDAL
jgi:hypothetical protein